MAKKKKPSKKDRNKEEVVTKAPPLTPDEIEKMEAEAEVLYKHKIIPEQQAEQEAVKKDFDEIIQTEEELLNIFSPAQYELEVLFENKLFRFQIKPLEATDDLSILDLDSTPYSDFDEEEMALMEKIQKGEQLTEEDLALIKDKDNKKKRDLAGELLVKVDEVLSIYLTPPDFEGDREKRKSWWAGVPFLFRAFLFQEVMKRLGMSQDINVKLFQGN